MRDLEIRGAGNLLGQEQHGHFAEVGYEMYCKMLEEAIGELTTDSVKPRQQQIETKIELPIDAYLPDDFIDSEALRIQIYRQIAMIENRQDLEATFDEMIDRFGNIPDCVDNLLQIALLRSLANRMQIEMIHKRNGRLIMRFSPVAYLDPGALIEGLRSPECALELQATNPLSMALREKGDEEKLVKAAIAQLEGLIRRTMPVDRTLEKGA
jgi:transcription-repair coupling factor (superfamily II helicase)